MAIADTIQSMYDNVINAYNVLEVAGADLTNVNKNILNLKTTWQERLLYFMNNGTDVVWNNWDKVTGEGTSISLNNTLEAKMKIELKGNTYQDSTTGKNLLNIYMQKNAGDSTTSNGITWTVNNDGSVTANGTATAQSTFYVFSDRSDSIASGGYTLYGYREDNKIMTGLGINTSDGYKYFNSFENVSTSSFTNPVVNYLVLRINSGVSVTNEKIYPMLVSGTYTKAEFPQFEMYTGEQPSPNPQYPQDIHVVSGDNTIKVCGKNLFHFESQRNTGWYSDVPNMIKEIGAYTLSINDTSLSGVWAAWFADNNGDRIGNFIKPSSSVSTPSTFNVTQEQANAPYIRILPNASGLHDIQNYKIQIEKGSTATTYEPYQEQNYSINLGVENLWKNQLNGFIPVTGSYPTTNSTYPNSRYIAVKLLKGQSLTLSGSTDNYGRCRYIDIDTNQSVGTITSSVVNDYYTSTGDFSNGFVEGTITAKKDFIVGIMDLRSTANSLVVNYGGKQTISDNPIELCKIGNYQDRFIRNSGKNKMPLLNGSATLNGLTITIENGIVTINGTASNGATFKLSNGIEGVSGASINDNWLSQLIIKNKKNYTISVKYLGGTGATSGCAFRLYSNTSTYLNQFYPLTQEQSLTYPDDGSISLITFFANPGNSFTNYKFAIQLEEGSSVTEFEPYGNGDWYLKKEIGKLVLDGTQNITQAPDGIRRFNARYTTLGLDNIKDGNGTYDSANYRLCDHFIHSNEDYHNQVWGVYYTYNGWLVLYDTNSVIADATALANWFSNNNTSIYYVYATPTYTKIEGELLSQLNALAKSYASQTNISQENNDLSSILNATALEEME